MRALRRDDQGSVAPLVPLLALSLLLLGGLVVDAGRLLNARGRAVAYAEEAARAGASSVVLGQAVLALDPGSVAARVEGYCDAVLGDPSQSGGVTDCALLGVEVVGPTDPRQIVVRVRVRLELPATLLGIVGVQTLTATGEGLARPFEGVDADDVDSDPPPVEVPLPVGPPDAPPGLEVPVAPPVPESPTVAVPPVDPDAPVPPLTPPSTPTSEATP